MIKQRSLCQLDGKDIMLYTLFNTNGISIDINNLGATITSIKAPDKEGHFQDIVLGFDNIDNYLEDNLYFGCTIGRYANRIANGKFLINGRQYNLDCNWESSHIHGGYSGFNKAVWQGSIDDNKLVMHHLSIDGDQGYPGNLDIHVTFELNKDNELDIKYHAVSDKDTIINMTNHSYFNLSGCSRDILDHYLKIYASTYTPVDSASIPTGEITSLKGTPLDFSKMTQIGKRINDDHPQLQICKGYDHNYVLDSEGICAEVHDPLSGRSLKVLTNKPGMQFYSGNYLNGIEGRDGIKYTKNFGFCLETQFFPDSPNNVGFSDCILKNGEVYSYKTTYCFDTI
jgi:aldose 1-epimerase